MKDLYHQPYLMQATGQVEAALAPLRDAEGELKPCLPRRASAQRRLYRSNIGGFRV